MHSPKPLQTEGEMAYSVLVFRKDFPLRPFRYRSVGPSCTVRPGLTFLRVSQLLLREHSPNFTLRPNIISDSPVEIFL